MGFKFRSKIRDPVRLFGICFLCFTLIGYASGLRVDNNPYHHQNQLDPNGKYALEWIVDLQAKRVTFNVTVETTGAIGFGINRKGQMDGADIVIGGVRPNGSLYFSDRHIRGRELIEDENQNWQLHHGRENTTHTFLTFSRDFMTCDPVEGNDIDLEVEGDLVSIIWAYMELDEVGYHFQNRGTTDIYFLDPDLTPREIESSPPFGNFVDGHVGRIGDWHVWTLSRTQPIPPQDTAYISTMHKAPNHGKKLHVVGFRTVLEGGTEERYLHHYFLHRCRPPPGVSANAFFGPWLSHPGEEAYVTYAPSAPHQMPYDYCQEVIHAWGPGGKPNFFPDHVGLGITEDPSGDEYFILQVHYNNPELRPALRARFALEVFYSEQLRKNDLGVIITGTTVPGSPTIMIPPSSINYTIYGHCGSECTKQIFPDQGIHIFAIIQHTHLAGRGSRAHHIRNNAELPLIMKDDNYNFNYQQIRTLNTERTVLPGDSIIIQCAYDTTDRNGSVTPGGYRTRHEMCSTLVWYYPYIRTGVHGLCASEQKSEMYKEFLGIYNTTWSDRDIENVITSPLRNSGLTVTQAGNRIVWTRERRRQLAEMHKTLPQATQCPDQVPTGERFEFQSVYVPDRVVPDKNPSVCPRQ